MEYSAATGVDALISNEGLWFHPDNMYDGNGILSDVGREARNIGSGLGGNTVELESSTRPWYRVGFFYGCGQGNSALVR